MNKIRIHEENKNLEELTTKRNLLFAQFSQNPSDTSPALEIKLLDDQIGKLRYPK